MAGSEQFGTCTVVWKIENFGYSGMNKGERIKSGFFYAHSNALCLMLYPRGKNDSKYITFEVYDSVYGLDLKISILDSEASPLVWKEIKNGSEVFKDLATREEIFGPRRATFLPNNTLTLEIKIAKSGEDKGLPFSKYICTRIQENRNVLNWDVPNFNTLQQGVKMVKQFPSMNQYDSTLRFELFLNGDDIQFNVTRIIARALDWGFCTCKIMLLDATGKKINFAESEFFYEGVGKVWQFKAYITKSMLMCEPNMYFPNGTLKLILEATNSSGVEYSRIES